MIAKFTTGADRGRLGFPQAVAREFAFLESTFGFRQVKESTTLVRYESDRLFLNVFHGRGSYEIGLELGRLSRPEVHYRLPLMVSALAPSYAGRKEFQASSRDGVERCVTELARTLKRYCRAVLRGDAEALRKVEKAARVQSERVTLQAQFGAIIDLADQAWETKDFPRAKELYEKAEKALDTTRKRRLEYLSEK